MNLLEGRLDPAGPAIVAAGLSLPLPQADRPSLAAYHDRPVILGIRPEDLSDEPHPGSLPVELRVVAIEALGPEVILIASLPAGPELAARMSRDFTAPIGSTQRLFLDPAAVHLFDPATTRAIPRAGGAPARAAVT